MTKTTNATFISGRLEVIIEAVYVRRILKGKAYITIVQAGYYITRYLFNCKVIFNMSFRSKTYRLMIQC